MGRPVAAVAGRTARLQAVVLAAFAIGDATGKVAFSQSVQSKSSFIDDVDALNKAHRPFCYRLVAGMTTG